MEEIEYIYWEIQYISCEDNYRRMVARTPMDWDADDVKSRMPTGGCGDDIAEITDVFETSKTDYYWDLCD
jgi:hypothetical protein